VLTGLAEGQNDVGDDGINSEYISQVLKLQKERQ
jgi:hypothetical protein